MVEKADQIFVILKHWIVGLFPESLQSLAAVMLSITPIMLVFPLLFAITTVLERKGLGRIQNRLGPNRVGPYGILQPIADGLKALTKEDVVPFRSDKVVHFLAPLVLVVPVFLGYSVLPMGRNMTALDLSTGVLFFFAIGAATELAVFMAGWSSRNKYSMLGSMRAIAQMVSYELPLILSAAVVVMLTGTLSTVQIVEAQTFQESGLQSWLPQWHVFTPWGLTAFVLFMIAASAESNRSPFDLPEAESELVAGYFTEYSGFKFALFFLGEYLGMFAISGLAITLFLGGWNAPFGFLSFIPSYLWFFGKLLAFICVFIWVRGTLPRLRVDQLMAFAWKFMLPMALINLPVAALWHYVTVRNFPGAWLVGWVLCGGVLYGAFVLLSKGFETRFTHAKRTYRFAD